MKRFIIEREIEGACDLSADQLAEIARTSNDAAASLGVPYTWVTSYVAGDKVFCVHEAPTTRRPSASIRAAAAFRPTSSPRWPPSSVRRRPAR